MVILQALSEHITTFINDFCRDFSLLGDLPFQHNWYWMLLCLGFVPVNIISEAMRWRVLLTNKIGLSYTVRAVLLGMSAGLLSPWRTLELPTRAWAISRKDNTISIREGLEAGVVSGIMITACIVCVGIVPLYLRFRSFLSSVTTKVIVGILLLFFVLLAYKWWMKKRNIVRSVIVKNNHWLKAIGWTIVRYVCFYVQWYCILHYVGCYICLPEFIPLVACYLLVITITPTVPIVDMPVRATWAAVVFGTAYKDMALPSVAATAIWLMNVILPALIGLILFRKK